MKKNVYAAFLSLCFAAPAIAQVEIDRPINMTGTDGDRKITNLETPIDGKDAVNKDYVDAAVSAGGGGSSKPSQISDMTQTAVTYADAVQYCEGLSEGGFDDWRLPDADEIQYFAGMSGATADFLWTKTMTGDQDFATNQNFVSTRLTDGKWSYGGINRFFFPSRSVSGSTTSSSYVTVATFEALTPGNLFVITNFTISAYAYYPVASARAKYTFPDGSFFYSPEIHNISYGTSYIANNVSAPILNDGASFLKIELEVRRDSGSDAVSGSITVTGYEIVLGQKDGATLNARCVR